MYEWKHLCAFSLYRCYLFRYITGDQSLSTIRWALSSKHIISVYKHQKGCKNIDKVMNLPDSTFSYLFNYVAAFYEQSVYKNPSKVTVYCHQIYVTIYKPQLHFSHGKTRVSHSPDQNRAFDGLFLASTSMFDTVVKSIWSKKWTYCWMFGSSQLHRAFPLCCWLILMSQYLQTTNSKMFLTIRYASRATFKRNALTLTFICLCCFLHYDPSHGENNSWKY